MKISRVLLGALMSIILIFSIQASAQQVDVNDLADALLEGFRNFEKEVAVSLDRPNSTIYFQDLITSIGEAYNKTEDSFYGYNVRSYRSVINLTADEIIVTLRPSYKNTQDELEEVEKIIDDVLMKIIRPSMSEREKARAIYDYVIDTLHYKNHSKIEGSDKSAVIRERNVLAALNGEGVVCEGYAILMHLMLEKAGIDTNFVVGYAGENMGGHIWNQVTINNRDYYIDATWGDSNCRQIQDKYFFISASALKKTHQW